MTLADRTVGRILAPDPVAGSGSRMASLSLRRRLWWLVVAFSLPTLGLAAAGLYSAYQSETRATDLRARETTRAVLQTLDREIEKSEVGLRVLALSPSLRSGDFAAFYKQALDANLADPAWIALIEPGGKILLNTRVPYGTALPDSTRSETLKQIAQTGEPELSNITVGAVTRQPLVTLDVPVFIDQRVAYILSIAVRPGDFQQLIANQAPADGWSVAILDRSGSIVARSARPEQFMGQQARPELREAIQSSREGDIDSVTLEGIPVRTYFARSIKYGWALVIGVPSSERSAAFQRSLGWFLALAAAILVCLGFAALLSRSIARPIDALAGAARDLGRGRAVASRPTGTDEFDVIQTALVEAAEQIKEQERERERAFGRAKDSEAKLRIALTAGELGAWEFTPATGEFITSPMCKANFGRAPEEPFPYQDLLSSIHPDDKHRQAASVAAAIENRTDLHVEYRAIWPDGTVHWVRVSGRALTGPDGRLSMVGVSQDVTERRRSDDRQRLLLHELNHRVKNTLATVQSVASLTQRAAKDGGDTTLWEAFTGRLQGLAKTNDLLTASNWSGADLTRILDNELGPYQDLPGRRIVLDGPRVSLNPSAALAVGLAIHELATNAAKYGALSLPEGRINVTWRLTPDTDPPLLVMEWTERSGPAVSAPTHEGFGSRLIRRGLAQQLGGEIKLDYDPEGVSCVISFPLRAIVANLNEFLEADFDDNRS